MANTPAKKSSNKTVQLTGVSVAAVAGFVLVRTGKKKPAAVKQADRANVLVAKAGRALSKPGIDRQVVFKGNQSRIFSYSTDPADPLKLVREAADGTKRVGLLVGAKFVPVKAA